MRKYKKFFRGFPFLKYKKFSRGEFFLFLDLGLKSAGLHSRKRKNFFNIRARKFHFPKYKEFFFQGGFFGFFGLGLRNSARWPLKPLLNHIRANRFRSWIQLNSLSSSMISLPFSFRWSLNFKVVYETVFAKLLSF